jgi:hypothetical protein
MISTLCFMTHPSVAKIGSVTDPTIKEHDAFTVLVNSSHRHDNAFQLVKDPIYVNTTFSGKVSVLNDDVELLVDQRLSIIHERAKAIDFLWSCYLMGLISVIRAETPMCYSGNWGGYVGSGYVGSGHIASGSIAGFYTAVNFSIGSGNIGSYVPRI